MIKIKPTANQIIAKLMYDDGVRAYYLSVCERYTKGYIQTFITDMQNLITKIGILISRIDINIVKISYCAQSIDYLCNKVLDRPSLVKTFSNVGINRKGNVGKHNITTNKIDMDKAVIAYNDLVNSISKKYKLPILTEMIVKKKKNDNSNIEHSNKHSASTPKAAIKSEERHTSNQIKNVERIKNKKSRKIPRGPREENTTNDERISLTARLERGDGRYTKGILWAKKKMLNFLLNVSIHNPDNLKISKATVIFKCNKNTEIRKISAEEDSTTNINLDATKFSGNIQASVIVVYKIGLFKTKQIKATVSKNF